MILELDEKEVEAVLMAYAEQEWPGTFNRVRSADYSRIPSVKFEKLEQPELEPLRAVA